MNNKMEIAFGKHIERLEKYEQPKGK